MEAGEVAATSKSQISRSLWIDNVPILGRMRGASKNMSAHVVERSQPLNIAGCGETIRHTGSRQFGSAD
ncbi:hypothetical protein HMPREF0733_11053 [Rothia dentocariosa ATCC 17931]|uniref:Uncharacterized protein n=1 Tax=Rothia dentocariosa (strain ATCC 17931 / CDC X599 / XDIA) TaxID=762948 RepID=E3H3W8_ROTDC|nr:hypothetical protein HMPREF0733_11053 [Rothia dentocariosa ATCC 17931]